VRTREQCQQACRKAQSENKNAANVKPVKESALGHFHDAVRGSQGELAKVAAAAEVLQHVGHFFGRRRVRRVEFDDGVSQSVAPTAGEELAAIAAILVARPHPEGDASRRERLVEYLTPVSACRRRPQLVLGVQKLVNLVQNHARHSVPMPCHLFFQPTTNSVSVCHSVP